MKNKKKKRKYTTAYINRLVNILMATFIVLVILSIVTYAATMWDSIVTLNEACFKSEACMSGQLNNYRIYAVIISFVVVTLSIGFMMMFVMLIRSDEKRFIAQRSEIDMVVNGLSSGVAKLSFKDDKLTISYANEGFYNMHGYARREYVEQFGNDPFALVQSKDQEILKEAFKRLAEVGQINAEYRITNANGTQRWLLINARLYNKGKSKLTFMCMFTDITKQKRSENELILSNERLSLVLENLEEVIMEYDLLEDTFINISHFRGTVTRLEDIYKRGYVSEKDYEHIAEMVRNCKRRRIHQAAQVHINMNGSFKWYEIHVTTLFNIEDEPVRAIVRLKDVDVSLREKEALIDMSQRDSMTGLYNKKFAEETIEICMANEKDTGALLLIDIDNFKAVNDTLGHAVGDEVITYVATELHNLFRSNDIVARIGGDEFIVYIRNYKEVELLKLKAQAICDMFTHFKFENSDRRVTCSIGIAMYNQDGSTYKELCSNADIAMYHCKKNGKNDFVFYQDVGNVINLSNDDKVEYAVQLSIDDIKEELSNELNTEEQNNS